MNLDGNFPSYETQQEIKNTVNGIKTTTDTTKTNVDTLLAGRVVKSVQRGTLIGPDTTANVNITISNVDPNKCAIIVGGKNQDTSTHIVPISITNTTLVLGRATKSSGVWSALSLASWQVIEFY